MTRVRASLWQTLVLKPQGLWRLKTYMCRCPHDGYSLTIREGKQKVSFGLYWGRVGPEDTKKFRAIFDAMMAFMKKHATKEVK